MSLIKLFIIAFIPISLFSYEISFSKKFTKAVYPSIISTNLTISYHYDNEQIVNKVLLNFIKVIEKTEDIKSIQTNYFIRKNIEYHNNKNIDKGYIGEVQYTLSTDNYTNIDELVYKLYNMKNDSAISIMTSNLIWDINSYEKDKIYDEIREKAHIWGVNYTISLSDKFSTECNLISINQVNPDRDMYRAKVGLYSESIRAGNEVLPIPNKELKEFNKSFDFKYECK